jgi:hypothetical protein
MLAPLFTNWYKPLFHGFQHSSVWDKFLCLRFKVSLAGQIFCRVLWQDYETESKSYVETETIFHNENGKYSSSKET